MREGVVRAAFAEQAMWCSRLGSPFTSLLCGLTGQRIDRSSAVGRQMLDWNGDPSPIADNLPARFCGGLHALVLQGQAAGLAKFYPPAGAPDANRLWDEIAAALDEHSAMLSGWLESPPQTNEVARSSTLMSGLLVVCDRFPLPIHLLELGSSGGLNLILDRYAHDLGGLHAGTEGSPVRLAPRWRGAPPPDARVRILSRRGVDLRPVDLRKDGGKLLAFVWADQIERRERLKAAIALASLDPPAVDVGDAADWLDSMLAESGIDGAVRVVMHSIAYQYFPEATKRRIGERMDAVGRCATADAPAAWLRYEQDVGEERPSLRLKLWPGGKDHLLAWCHGHGASVEWIG